MKKILAFILCAVLVCACVPFAVSAAEAGSASVNTVIMHSTSAAIRFNLKFIYIPPYALAPYLLGLCVFVTFAPDLLPRSTCLLRGQVRLQRNRRK